MLIPCVIQKSDQNASKFSPSLSILGFNIMLSFKEYQVHNSPPEVSPDF